ncbi:uncharacterized protein HMPREF1541_01252 [Cyphellophora europaea CBS 101466]|uniref:Uncharacterized protein n=1 Tax=Cyphellophora europaea (strain CBS 101466) TaxID=1220924 RepID=W2SEE2_CYPE1|nr:uncharacterized protein HMPREF1541_01252 [Cyphellophora europaea CBS 101466]ETN47062.1 hypothetical protein HMPREF1541_01252 [Cyphellophora europaea CBS 101466]
MRVSPTFLLRSIVSKLHPPSPATARESQRLLRSLDGAFRKRLDEVHPAPSLDAHRESDAPADGNHSVNTHLDAILQHPLLQSKNTAGAQPGSSRAVTLIDRILREGALDMDSLRKAAQIYLSDAQTFKRNEREQLAPRLAAWMASASDAQRTEFFTTSTTVGPVLLVMSRDGADETVWEWLKHLHRCKDASFVAHQQHLRTWLDAEDEFVSCMISNALRKKQFTAAAQQYVAAAAHRATLPQPAPMIAAWTRIASLVAMKRRRHGIPSALFSRVLAHAPPLDAMAKTYYSSGFLALYHPDRPSVQPLYHDLHNEAFVAHWSKWKWRRTTKIQQALLTAILDAADMASSRGKTAQARFFLDFAQTHFPDIVSRAEAVASPAARLDQAREELESHRGSIDHGHLEWAVG